MITTSEFFKLSGSTGHVLHYEDDTYFIDSVGVVYRVAPEVFQALQNGAQLIPHGGVFERSSAEAASLTYSDWKTSSLHRELYQAEIRTEVIICDNKLFYLKKSFLEDFPDGTYIFSSECGMVLEITTSGSQVTSYRMLDGVDAEVVPTNLSYLSRFNGVTYTKLWQVEK